MWWIGYLKSDNQNQTDDNKQQRRPTFQPFLFSIIAGNYSTIRNCFVSDKCISWDRVFLMTQAMFEIVMNVYPNWHKRWHHSWSLLGNQLETTGLDIWNIFVQRSRTNKWLCSFVRSFVSSKKIVRPLLCNVGGWDLVC